MTRLLVLSGLAAALGAQEFAVRAVSISGNQALTAAQIRSVMLTRPRTILSRGLFYERILTDDLASIVALYQRNGYLAATVSDSVARDAPRGLVTVFIRVVEGSQTRVGAVLVEGNRLVTRARLDSVLTLRAGQPLDRSRLEDDNTRLVTFYDDLGYGATRVRTDLSLAGGLAEVRHQIFEAGPLVVDSVSVTGLVRTRPEVVRRELAVRPGDVFRLKRVLESERNLRSLGVFASVRAEVTTSAGNPLHRVVHFTVREARPVNLGLRVGYGTEDLLRVGASIAHRNLLGRAWTGSLGGKQSFVEQKLELGFDDRRTFASRANTHLRGYFTRRVEDGFKWDALGAVTALAVPIRPGLAGSVSYNLRRVTVYDVKVAIPTVAPGLVQGIQTALERDSRDDIFEPGRGTLTSLGADVYGLLLAGDADYLRFRLQAAAFQTVVKPVLAIRAQVGWALPYGTTTAVPIYDRFFLGGATSVRGFAERAIGPRDSLNYPLGGDLFTAASVELRIPVWRSLGAVLFFDAGNLWATAADFTPALRTGAGAGLRLKTPLGSVRLDGALNLAPQADEPRWRLHFAVGEAF